MRNLSQRNNQTMSSISRQADEVFDKVDYWLRMLEGCDSDWGLTNATSLADYTLLELKELKQAYDHVKEEAKILDALREKLGEKKKLINTFVCFENLIGMIISLKTQEE